MHLINRNQAAEIMGVKPNTLAVWATTQRYDLPFIKIGRLVKYKLEDVESFINSNKKGGENV